MNTENYGKITKMSTSSFSWEINDFINIINKEEDYDIRSDGKFMFGGRHWHLQLLNTPKKSSAVTYFRLVLHSVCNINHSYKYKLCIKDIKGGDYWTSPVLTQEFSYFKKFGFIEELPVAGLVRDANRIAPGGVLSLHLIFNPPEKHVQPAQKYAFATVQLSHLGSKEAGTQTDLLCRQENSSNILTTKSEATFLEALSDDFLKYFVGQVNTDCVLKVGGARIPAHRTVLSARSEVFAAMFRNDTVESRSGEVNIKNVEEATLRDVLYYMYSGKICGLTSDSAMAMYEAADMYDLTVLKGACLDHLLQNLTTTNIYHAALLADTYGEAGLDTEISKFVGSRLGEITQSYAWKKFFEEKPLIVNKILQTILLTKK